MTPQIGDRNRRRFPPTRWTGQKLFTGTVPAVQEENTDDSESVAL